MIDRQLTEGDAKAMGWNSLQQLADYITVRFGVDDATTKKAMERAPGAWRLCPEVKRQ